LAAGAQRAHNGLCHRALEWDFVDMEDCYPATEVFSPRSTSTGARIAKVLRRWTEGARKAEKAHGRWTEGALVRQRADANSEDSTPSCSKTTSEGVRKVDGRRLGGTEGGAKAGDCDRLTISLGVIA
jgi:hypothetical protein